MDKLSVETVDSNWRNLYRIGGVAALIAVVVFRRNCGAELTLFGAHTHPSAAGDWFALLQNEGLAGLILLDLFDVANYALIGLMYLAVYVALRRVNESLMRIAVTLGLVGIAVYFASNQAFAMLSLSGQYAAATTEAQSGTFLAAGEALLAIAYQGTGYYLGLFLVTLAGLIISVVMLRSGIFSKTTAYFGIVANVLVLGYFVALAFAPELTFLPHTAAAVPLLIWEVLIARRLFQLAREIPNEATRN